MGEPEQRFLLVKRGLYYAPNNQGYTGVKERAGRYREVDALGLDGVTAIHEDKAPLFAPACWRETKAAFYEEKIAAFAEREARNLSDIQRLVWKDELAGICETLESCFDHGGPARCGPCAIKASLAKGVEPDYTLPSLPEVSRLKRENARLVRALESAWKDDVCDHVCNAENGKTIGSFDAIWEKSRTLAALKDRTDG